jgi:hypothetical protein
MMLTQVVPADLPIPDLEQLTSDPRKDERRAAPAPKGFDPHSPRMKQVIEDIAKSKPSATESGSPPRSVVVHWTGMKANCSATPKVIRSRLESGRSKPFAGEVRTHARTGFALYEALCQR